MTNELATINNDMSYADIAKITGVSVSDSSGFLPYLTINRDVLEKSNGKKTAELMGHWALTQDSKIVYDNVASFRPFINCYQYVEYDPEVKKFANRSVIIRNFQEEAFDTKGGLACNKVNRKEWSHLPAEEVKRQENITCRRLMYGLVTFYNAKDVDGKEVDGVANIPCLWRCQKSAFMAPDEAIKAVAKQKKHLFQHIYMLTTEEARAGATTYYKPVVQVDFGKTLNLSEEDIEHYASFNELITAESEKVLKLWKQAKREQVKASSITPNGKGSVYFKDLELNDEIPFEL